MSVYFWYLDALRLDLVHCEPIPLHCTEVDFVRFKR